MASKKPAELTPEAWKRIGEALDWTKDRDEPETGMIYVPRAKRFYPANRKPREASVDMPSGLVYFIGGDDGPVKIGYTSNLPVRFLALQNGSAIKLKVLEMRPGTRMDEHTLHARFSAARMTGEWFERTPDLLVMIAAVHEAEVRLNQGLVLKWATKSE